jgi:hypothetical protein
MTDEPLQRDPAMARALGEITDDIRASADVTRLRHAIGERAASELARRRQGRKRTGLFMPASLAAGITLFVLVAHGPRPVVAPDPSNQAALTDVVSIDELLDANVSDGQFRALVSGAGDANDLLSIAAEEGQ